MTTVRISSNTPIIWQKIRLKRIAKMNPSKGEINSLPGTTKVTFLPMEVVSESWLVDYSITRPLEEVRSGYTYFKNGDILIAKITPCFENGKGALVAGCVNGIGFGTTEFHVIRSSDYDTNRFLSYVVRSHQFKFEGGGMMTGAAGQKRVPDDYIKNFEVFLPPLELRGLIASFLDRKTAAIDTLIAKKQRLIELLEEKRTALINQAVTKGLNPNAPMKGSGIFWIGKIPEHWEICPLKYVTTFTGGSTPDKSNLAYWNGSIPWVTPKDMKRFWIGESIDCITELATQETSIKIIQPPVILVVVRGMILAHSFPVALTTSPLTINQDMKALNCSSKTITEFLARQLSACKDGVLSLIQEAGHGTKALRIDLFEKLFIVLPPIKEQKEICSYTDNEAKKFTSIITRLNSQIEKIQEYRRSLITAAVTGKLDVTQEKIL